MARPQMLSDADWARIEPSTPVVTTRRREADRGPPIAIAWRACCGFSR